MCNKWHKHMRYCKIFFVKLLLLGKYLIFTGGKNHIRFIPIVFVQDFHDQKSKVGIGNPLYDHTLRT